MENTLVWCKTKAQLVELLTEAKRKGYNIDSPTDMANGFWANYHENTVVNLNGNGRSITYCYKDWYIENPSYGNIISADKFLVTRPILITRKGRAVTAENKNNGEKAIATCCPTDTFDFGTGAMIAVARLIAQSDKGITKDAETVLRQLLGYDTETPKKVEELINGEHKYVVGDRVRVKAWEVMKGTPNFVSTMRHLCGRTATITNVYYNNVCAGNHSYGIDLEFDDDSGDTRWQYQACMVEPLDESKPEMPTTKFKVGDLVTLKDDIEVHKRYDGITLLENMYRNGHRKPIKVIDVDCNEHYDCAPLSSHDGSTVSYWYSEVMLEAWDKSKIYEGDIVRVVNTGLNYSTYPQWVGEHISDPDMAARYCFGSPSTDGNYKVIKIAEHESNGRTLAYIEQCDGFVFNKCYLVEIKGLEKVTE